MQGLHDDVPPRVDGNHESSEPLASEAVFVGDGCLVVPIDVVKQTGSTVCYLSVNTTVSGPWDQDELGADQTLEPLQSATLELPAASCDFRATDCDGAEVAEVSEVPVGEQEQVVLARAAGPGGGPSAVARAPTGQAPRGGRPSWACRSLRVTRRAGLPPGETILNA